MNYIKYQRNSRSHDFYPKGSSIDIKQEVFAPGLDEDVVRKISSIKKEPAWLLDWRLASYQHLLTMTYPAWANITYPSIDFQKIIYFAQIADESQDLSPIYSALQLPINSESIAVDTVFDSSSIGSVTRKKLLESGVIFCSFSQAVQLYPELVQQYLGTVVTNKDNYFSTLNSAVFSDGSFVYIPKGVVCPLDLSTYFRINAINLGQFERTLIVAAEGSQVSYLEGCTAPIRQENQLHAAVVEIVALEGSYVKYSTVQNWYPGDKVGVGGIYNFVTKRAIAEKEARVAWIQVETGSSITWKYPSVVLKGDNSKGEFYSLALTKNYQQADTGTKMIHIGKNTSSYIVSKGVSAGFSKNTYRGLVKISKQAHNAKNFTQCDSLILGDNSSAYAYPKIINTLASAQLAHEAVMSRISEEQLLYSQQRNICQEEAISMIVNGFCKAVFSQLPLEFAMEARELINASLENINA